ncbi:MAG: transposase [Planctomycetota bacterium]|jgi:transposase
MAIIPQKQLFSWKEIEDLGDLQRLELVLKYLPDEPLMRLLESHRGKGRNDYPIRAVWNSLLAGIVFQHNSIESLRRELFRNGQLRWLCGFDLAKAAAGVPPAHVYTRFLKLLLRHTEQIEHIFDDLVEQLRKELPGFGTNLAIDGKAIDTHARPRKGLRQMSADGRRDTDADFGKKTYTGVRENGTTWQNVVKWFGYKLHLIVDADYELPVAFEVTKASSSEIPEGRKLVKQLKQRHADLVEQDCEALIGDRGLDDTELIVSLWDDCGIKPMIDIRDMWKDGEETKLADGQTNVVYDYRGNVYCYCPMTGERRQMSYGGFEKDRQALKYRCPAFHYGFECKGCNRCGVTGAVRIKLSQDRRVFTPLARSSYRWKQTYKKRTSVERVNSRLDVSFCFEQHFIRGQRKMKLRMGLALVVMLAMALGRVKEKQKDKIRSLVQAA